jgi:hypothetical protein
MIFGRAAIRFFKTKNLKSNAKVFIFNQNIGEWVALRNCVDSG